MPRRITRAENKGITVGNADPQTFPGQIPQLLYKLTVGWIELEVRLGLVIIDFLGIDTPDTIDFINNNLFGKKLRDKLSDTARENIVDLEANELFQNVMLAIDGQAKIRNKIFHWSKLTSTSFPDAILLQEPKYIWYSELLKKKYSNHITDACTSNEQLEQFWRHAEETKTNGTWVFFEDDFRSYLENINLFNTAFFELMWWHRGSLIHHINKEFLRENFSNIDRFNIDFTSDPIRPL